MAWTKGSKGTMFFGAQIRGSYGRRIQRTIRETASTWFDCRSGKMHQLGLYALNLRPREYQYHATKGWRSYRIG